MVVVVVVVAAMMGAGSAGASAPEVSAAVNGSVAADVV